MIVKDKVGRRRYIAFTVENDRRISKEEIKHMIFQSLRRKCSNISLVKPKLIWFEDNKGILRCTHSSKEETINALNSPSSGIHVRTIKTSGTIKGAKRYFYKRV